MVNKRVWNAVLGCNIKNDRMIFVCLQGKPFNITIIQIYAPTSNAEEAEVEVSIRSFRTNTQKRCPFHYRGLEHKSRKSRNTWSNRQIWPWNTEWRGQRVTEFCQENTLVIANTLFQKHKTRLYTRTSPDGQYRNQIDILCIQRWRCSIQSAKTIPGADCGSDHEQLIAKFKLKLKKVGKTTRLFRIWKPHNYTVEVRNRVKGLDLMDSEGLWMEVHDIVQETGSKTIPKKKKCKKAKWLSEEALQIAVKRREVKGKGEKKDIPVWMQSSKK